LAAQLVELPLLLGDPAAMLAGQLAQ